MDIRMDGNPYPSIDLTDNSLTIGTYDAVDKGIGSCKLQSITDLVGSYTIHSLKARVLSALLEHARNTYCRIKGIYPECDLSKTTSWRYEQLDGISNIVLDAIEGNVVVLIVSESTDKKNKELIAVEYADGEILLRGRGYHKGGVLRVGELALGWLLRPMTSSSVCQLNLQYEFDCRTLRALLGEYATEISSLKLGASAFTTSEWKSTLTFIKERMTLESLSFEPRKPGKKLPFKDPLSSRNAPYEWKGREEVVKGLDEILLMISVEDTKKKTDPNYWTSQACVHRP